MVKNGYILSYDFGTSGVKVAAADMAGNLCFISNSAYPLYFPKANHAEQDPSDYWNAFCECTRNVLRKGNIPGADINGICLSTQWKGIIPLDKDDIVLHNSIIWMDARGDEEAEELNRIFHTTEFNSQSYHAKLWWYKKNCRDLFDRTETILDLNAFIRYRLTGVKASDISNNFTSSLKDRKVLEAIGYPLDMFPERVESTVQTGVTIARASEAGLPPGIKVFAGTTDIVAVATGAGCVREGMYHAYLGTSGWIGVSTPDSLNIDAPYARVDRNSKINIYGLHSVGNFLNWGIDNFYHAEKDTYGDGIYKYIDEVVENIPLGSGSLLATPWLSGELPPLSAKARTVFLNVSAMHTREYFMNAIMESVCYAFKMRFDEIAKTRPEMESLDYLNIVGGGANSSKWMQSLSDVLGIEIRVPAFNQHSGAIGGAICALVGLGVYKSIDEGARSVRVDKVFKPNMENHEKYMKIYEIYMELYPRLEDIFERLQSL